MELPEYIHEIKTPAIRRLWMIPSVISIGAIGVIAFICSVIAAPKLIKVHANFGTALFMNGVISMWHGFRHVPFQKLRERYYDE